HGRGADGVLRHRRVATAVRRRAGEVVPVADAAHDVADVEVVGVIGPVAGYRIGVRHPDVVRDGPVDQPRTFRRGVNARIWARRAHVGRQPATPESRIEVGRGVVEFGDVPAVAAVAIGGRNGRQDGAGRIVDV